MHVLITVFEPVICKPQMRPYIDNTLKVCGKYYMHLPGDSVSLEFL